jgi:hypothetical protein
MILKRRWQLPRAETVARAVSGQGPRRERKNAEPSTAQVADQPKPDRGLTCFPTGPDGVQGVTSMRDCKFCPSPTVICRRRRPGARPLCSLA